jgi:hypothetical protein
MLDIVQVRRGLVLFWSKPRILCYHVESSKVVREYY